MDDQTLIQNYKSTQNASFLGDLFQKHFHLIYGLCLKLLKNEDNAKDVCMSIYELLGDKLLKHDVQQFNSWLYRVTYNECLQFLNKEKKRLTQLDVYSLSEKENMEFSLYDYPNIEREELLQHLEACLDTLKEVQKESIKLFFLQKKCYNEIVALTGYSIKKVKSYIQNGKRNLLFCMRTKQ